MTEEIGPRSSFPHGNDCQVTFLRRADNKKAFVDVWHINAKGHKFVFHLMRMRASAGPWVFGSFQDEDEGQWSFRDDVRVKAGFRGLTYTVVDSAQTYVVFEADGCLVHLVAFVPFLVSLGEVLEENDVSLLRRVAQAQDLSFVQAAETAIPDSEIDQQQFFIEVISRMCRV